MAKFVTDRHEIAKLMNFGKYPVLKLDRENHLGYENTDYCKGSKVRIEYESRNYGKMLKDVTLYMENGKYGFSSPGCFLNNSFGYSDVMEMADWAETQIVHKGETVVLVEYWKSERNCRVRLMKVSERIDIHCETVATLLDI